MLPLKDLTPRRSFPAITLLLIAVNFAVFAYQLSLPVRAGEVLLRTYGLSPYKIPLAFTGHRFTVAQALLPFLTCMFLHGGVLHILGNMWFLWIFGGNMEERLGSLGYLLLYFVSGTAAGISQVAFSWGSHVPSIGASGAISGVLGAYLILYPASRILTLVPLLFVWWIRLPAFVFIGLWFLMQFLNGLVALGPQPAASAAGIAWWAHVGGFLAGVLWGIAVRTGSRRADI